MNRITLPVVAHRLFGFGHREGTVWEHTPSQVMRVAAVQAFDVLDMGGEDEDETQASDLHVTRKLLYVAGGTRRSIDEMRDLFDGKRRATTSDERCVNAIWEEQANIRFKLIAIVDHAILTPDAYLMTTKRIVSLAKVLNHAAAVNMYFVRELRSGYGVASPSLWPDDSEKRPAYAAVCDWENRDNRPWENTVYTAAHELGHLLSLRHHESYENVMSNKTTPDGTLLDSVQIMVARSHAKRYLPKVHQTCKASTEFLKQLIDPDAEPKLMKEYLGKALLFTD